MVESEARIIRSLATARAVVDRLGLDKQAPARPGVVERAAQALFPQPVRDGVRELLGLGRPAGGPARRDVIAQGLLGGLTVGNDAKAYLITLTYRDTDPERAARIVNAFGAEYMRRKLDANTASAQRSGQWYAAQMQEARADLARIDKDIEAFRLRTGFVELGQDGVDLQQQLLRDSLAQLNAASVARLAEEARLRRAQDALAAGNIPQATDLGGSPVVQILIDEESKARRALEELVASTGERHPAVARQRLSLAAVQERLKKQVGQAVGNIETDVNAARAVEQKLAAQVTTLQQKSIEAKGLESQLRSMQAEASGARDRLKLMSDAYQQAGAASELKPVMAHILAPAEVPSLPNTPNPLLMLGLAMVGGLGAGAGLCYALEKRDAVSAARANSSPRRIRHVSGCCPISNAIRTGWRASSLPKRCDRPWPSSSQGRNRRRSCWSPPRGGAKANPSWPRPWRGCSRRWGSACSWSTDRRGGFCSARNIRMKRCSTSACRRPALRGRT